MSRFQTLQEKANRRGRNDFLQKVIGNWLEGRLSNAEKSPDFLLGANDMEIWPRGLAPYLKHPHQSKNMRRGCHNETGGVDVCREGWQFCEFDHSLRGAFEGCDSRHVHQVTRWGAMPYVLRA